MLFRSTGAPFNPLIDSACLPLGYIDHCDGQQEKCYVHLVRVNGSYCDALLKRLNQEQKHAADLLGTQISECFARPQSAQCSSAASNYQAAGALVQQLAAQYRMCRMASMPGN